jgi:hypothetical protein
MFQIFQSYIIASVFMLQVFHSCFKRIDGTAGVLCASAGGGASAWSRRGKLVQAQVVPACATQSGCRRSPDIRPTSSSHFLPGTEPVVGQPGLEPPTTGESMEPPEPRL